MRTVFSYSLLSTPCPRFMKQVRIDKAYKEKPSPKMQRGKDRHKALENAIKYGQSLSAELEHMLPWVNRFVKTDAFVQTELRLAITYEWKGCGFFHSMVFYRGVLDATADTGELSAVVDWKDGNPNYGDTNQLDTQACLLFLNRPRLQEIKSALVWTKPGAPPTRKDYTRKQLPDLKAGIAHQVERFRKLERAKNWPAVSCYLCRTCPIKDCEFNENDQDT